MKLSKNKDGYYELDVRGYDGPHLYLYVSNALEKLKSGEALSLIYDDTYSKGNLSTAFNKGAYEILRRTRDGATYRLLIKKK
jgi:TusA-related sulfurtransferase